MIVHQTILKLFIWKTLNSDKYANSSKSHLTMLQLRLNVFNHSIVSLVIQFPVQITF